MRFFISTARTADLAALGELLAAGTVTPVVERSYALRDAAEALRYSASMLLGARRRHRVTVQNADGLPGPVR